MINEEVETNIHDQKMIKYLLLEKGYIFKSLIIF